MTISKKLLTLGLLLLHIFAFSQEDVFKKSVKFGGRLMFDMTQYKMGSETFNGSEFRRVRFYGSAKLAPNVSTKVQMDFAKSKVSFKDVFVKIGIPNLGGHLFVGRFKEPSRLNQLTSSKYITFIERASLVHWAERNQGLMYENSQIYDGKIGFQIGYFFGENTGGVNHIFHTEKGGLGKSISMRLTGLAFDDKENNRIFHLGASYSYRVPDLDKDSLLLRHQTIKTKAPLHLAPTFEDQTFKKVHQINNIGFETFAIFGSLSLQAEYLYTIVNTQNHQYNIPSYYAYVSYFLTGEHRNFKNSFSAFSGVHPKKNFSGKNRGWGAFEIAARYSVFDMSNITPKSVVSDVTFGINWYLNPYTRVMYNYVIGKDELLDDKLLGNVVRIQTVF